MQTFEEWMRGGRGFRVAGTNTVVSVCEGCGGTEQLKAANEGKASAFLFSFGAVARSLAAHDRLVCPACRQQEAGNA